MNYLEQVKEFMNYAGQDISEEISIDNKNINELRSNLIHEEWHELEDALHYGNKEGVLDALCDLQYVLSGAILALGFEKIFNEAFAEVQASNMSKFPEVPGTQEEQENIVPLDKEVPTRREIRNKRFVFKRLSDNKVMKPNTFFEPNLKQFIDE